MLKIGNLSSCATIFLREDTASRFVVDRQAQQGVKEAAIYIPTT